MNSTSNLEVPILRENPILGNDPFGLDVDDILILKQRVDNNVDQLHSLTTKLRTQPNFNKQARKQHQETIQFFEKERELLSEGTPDEMLERLRSIYTRVAELGYAELTSDQIGETISNEFPDDYHRFHEIMRATSGPHYHDMARSGKYSWLHSLEGPWQRAENEKIRTYNESQKPSRKLARLIRGLMSKNKLK